MTEKEAAGECPECNAPFEVVSPGKALATCDCQERCLRCHRAKFYHPEAGVHAVHGDGFVCPVCDLDRDPFDFKRLYDA